MKNQVNLFYDIVHFYKIPTIEKVEMLVGILKDFPYSVTTSKQLDRFLFNPCENDFYYFYMESQTTSILNISNNNEKSDFNGYILESLTAYKEDVSVITWIVNVINAIEIKEHRRYLIMRYGYNLTRSEIEEKYGYSIKKQRKSEEYISDHFEKHMERIILCEVLNIKY